MKIEQAISLANTAATIIESALTMGAEIVKAIQESQKISAEDKDALIGRIRAAQASVPEWK